MNESRKEQIEGLEQELLDFEAAFSSGKTVDVVEVVLKSKKLASLVEEQAFQEGLEEGITEGLKAGLVLQSVKKRQQLKENPSNKIDPLKYKQDAISLLTNKEARKEGLEQVKENLLQGVTGKMVPPKETKEHGDKIHHSKSTEPMKSTENRVDKESLGTENHDFQWEESVFIQKDTTEKESVKEKKPNRDWSEVNLGKYIMGILAAILALTGTALLGALSWQYLSDPVKALLLGSVGGIMVALPTFYIHKQGEEVKNGFLTSVMGAGLSILYMNVLFLGIWWKLIGDTPMLLGLIALIFLTAYLAHHIHSNTLLVVSYLGNIGTFLILYVKILTLSQLYIAIPSLLITGGLLMVYTLKSEWTGSLTKGMSLILGGIAMVLSTENVLNNFYFANYSTGNIPRFTEFQSPYFMIYGICFLFALGIGLLFGAAGSRLEEYDLYQQEEGKKNKGAVIHGGLLFSAYMMFAQLFSDIPEWYLLLIASTFVLNQVKVVPALVSMFFVFDGVDSLVWDRVDTLFQFTERDSRNLVCYVVMMCIVFGLYFFGEKENTKGRLLVKVGYAWGASTVFLSCRFKEMDTIAHVLAIPLLLCCGLYFYRGLQKSEENDGGWDSFWDLLYYIPFILLLGNQLDRTMPDSYSVVPSLLLIFVALLKIGEKLLPPMESLQWNLLYKITLEGVQILGFMAIADQMGGRDKPYLIALWILAALLLVLVESFYQLIKGEFVISLLKYKYMISIPMVFHTLTQFTSFGEIAVTSSVILICSGSLSIYFGFRHTEQNLRQLGLAMSILSVLKMVIFDVSSSDSITRVLAMIFGAVLCFGISHVYNKLE